MSMSASNIYKQTIMTMMYFVLMFKIKDIESESKKYELIYRLGQKLLLLKNFVLYIYIDIKKDGKAVNVEIPEREAKSSFTLSLPQLYLGVHIVESFHVALIQPSKSRFAANPDLSDINYICCHTCIIISMEKDISFSPYPYCLDTLSPPVFAPKVIDKVAYYSRLSLKQANVFHIVCME